MDHKWYTWKFEHPEWGPPNMTRHIGNHVDKWWREKIKMDGVQATSLTPSDISLSCPLKLLPATSPIHHAEEQKCAK